MTLKELIAYVKGFHAAIDCDGGTLESWKSLRALLIREEYLEVLEALQDFQPSDTASREALGKEIGDLIYVLAGTCIKYNIDLGEHVQMVCQRNNKRLQAGVVKNEAGKFIKQESRPKLD